MSSRHSSFSVLLVGSLSFAVFAFSMESSSRRQRAPEEKLRVLRSDASFFWGEGWAPMQNDMGEAKNSAKARALADLSSNVKVKVQSTFVDVIGRGPRSEWAVVESRVQLQTEELIAQLEVEEYALNAPVKGQMTCLVGFPKSTLEDAWAKSLRGARENIEGAVRFAQDQNPPFRWAEGWRLLQDAVESYHRHFNHIPLWAENNGTQRDLAKDLDNQIKRWSEGVSLAVLPPRLYFDLKGQLKQPVTIQILHTRKVQTSLGPVRLYGEFLRGRGVLPKEKWSTDDHGRGSVQLDFIDPYEKEATLKISLLASSSGEGESFWGPFAFVEMGPSPQVILRFKSADAPSAWREQATRQWEERFSSHNWVVRADSEAGEDEDVFRRARRAGADYVIFFSPTVTLSKHPRLSVYQARSRAELIVRAAAEEEAFITHLLEAEHSGPERAQVLSRALDSLSSQALRFLTEALILR